MRALVTGGTGFIGSNIVRQLLADGAEVIITGHDAEQRIPEFHGLFLQPSFLGLDWDAIGPVDVVFHQAAINNTLSQNRRELLRANVDSSQALFEHAVAGGCRRIVYASTTAVYGNGTVPYREDQPLAPLNPYAESKQALDALARRFASEHPDVTIVGLRYCNVYGPGERHKGVRSSMIPQLARQMLRGNPRLFKRGEQQRDYIYVTDVVRANLLAAHAPRSGIVNCGSGTSTPFNTLVTLLNAVLGTSRVPEYIENPAPEAYQTHTLCDMSRARELLGFVPEVSIEQGIRAYFESGELVVS